VIVAFDDDPAGRKAAVRAYGILRPLTATLRSANLSGRDPAQVLQEEGPQALRDILTTQVGPLLGNVVDAELSRWEHQLDETEGPLRAMRATAAVLGRLLLADAAAQLRQSAGNAELAVFDDQMRPVLIPQLPQVARNLPADTASQAVRLADRLGFPADEVLIEIANAVTRQAGQRTAARLAVGSFPTAPLGKPDAEATTELRRAPAPGRPRPNARRA
jgi:DNA primase